MRERYVYEVWALTSMTETEFPENVAVFRSVGSSDDDNWGHSHMGLSLEKTDTQVQLLRDVDFLIARYCLGLSGRPCWTIGWAYI